VKLFSVSEGVNVDDYVLPLCFEKYNKEAIEECFWENYAIKHDKFLNSFEFNDIILNMIPDEIISHLYMDKLFVIYFHSKRRSNLFIPIHKDHSKTKFTGSINLPVYNCTKKVRTNFWLPIGKHTSIQMPKSTAYESGELKLAVEFSLTDTPVLFNNGEYHSVFNPLPQEEERAMISLRFDPKYSWNEIKTICRKYCLPIQQTQNST
jgi:hypothetical protein